MTKTKELIKALNDRAKLKPAEAPLLILAAMALERDQAKIDAVREFVDALWDTGELSGRDGEFVVSFSKEFIEQLKEQGNE